MKAFRNGRKLKLTEVHDNNYFDVCRLLMAQRKKEESEFVLEICCSGRWYPVLCCNTLNLNDVYRVAKKKKS